MKKILLALLLVSGLANAGQVNVEWVAPTEREDNTPLSQSEIGGYRVYGNGVMLTDTADGLVNNAVIDLANGFTYNLAATTYDTSGRESAMSNVVVVTLDAMPPKSMTITVTLSP